MWPFTRPVEPQPVNHGQALAKIGHEQRRAKYRATAREICRCTGLAVPSPLQDKEA